MDEIRFCGKCGAQLPDNAEFCGNCGTKQNTVNGQANMKKTNKWRIIGIVAAVLLVPNIIGMTVENLLQNTSDSDNKTSITETENDIDYNSHFDEEKEDEQKEDEKEYKKGTFTATTYESEFIGIRYTAPDGWALATESELQQIPSNASTTTEMQTLNSLDGSNIMILVEKMSTSNFTMDMYIYSLKSSLQSNGQVTITDIKEDGTYLIAGEEYNVLSYTASQDGVSYSQTVYLRKINSHMIVITVTSASADNEELLSNFVKY